MKYRFVFILLILAFAQQGFAQQQDTLPSIPSKFVRMLWDSCTLVDYTFFDLPISMSLTEKASIQQSLRHIGSKPVVGNPPCKPIAKVFYQVNANIVLEADMYFSNNCTYFIFYKDGKKYYSNTMSNEGVQFFNKTLSSVTNKPKK